MELVLTNEEMNDCWSRVGEWMTSHVQETYPVMIRGL